VDNCRNEEMKKQIKKIFISKQFVYLHEKYSRSYRKQRRIRLLFKQLFVSKIRNLWEGFVWLNQVKLKLQVYQANRKEVKVIEHAPAVVKTKKPRSRMHNPEILERFRFMTFLYLFRDRNLNIIQPVLYEKNVEEMKQTRGVSPVPPTEDLALLSMAWETIYQPWPNEWIDFVRKYSTRNVLPQYTRNWHMFISIECKKVVALNTNPQSAYDATYTELYLAPAVENMVWHCLFRLVFVKGTMIYFLLPRRGEELPCHAPENPDDFIHYACDMKSIDNIMAIYQVIKNELKSIYRVIVPDIIDIHSVKYKAFDTSSVVNRATYLNTNLSLRYGARFIVIPSDEKNILVLCKSVRKKDMAVIVQDRDMETVNAFEAFVNYYQEPDPLFAVMLEKVIQLEQRLKIVHNYGDLLENLPSDHVTDVSSLQPVMTMQAMPSHGAASSAPSRPDNTR